MVQFFWNLVPVLDFVKDMCLHMILAFNVQQKVLLRVLNFPGNVLASDIVIYRRKCINLLMVSL
jgi:hypothetical protein